MTGQNIRLRLFGRVMNKRNIYFFQKIPEKPTLITLAFCFVKTEFVTSFTNDVQSKYFPKVIRLVRHV